MKSFEFGAIFPNNKRENPISDETSESDSEDALAIILAKPENAFLKMPQNISIIENAKTAHEALEFALNKIHERLTVTLDVKKIAGGHLETIAVNPESVINAYESIQRNAVEIGRGADARVIIDTADIYNINPEICYKIALQETLKRGRNSISEEAEMQSEFYEVSQTIKNQRIGVPTPFYEIGISTIQMIAMEKLHARSVDEILRGIASLPDWFDTDVFCDSLTEFLDVMHANNLYHRDMHFGNIMISQNTTWNEGEQIGYVIDFGLSTYGFSNMEPYKKEVAGDTFTYDDDYGRINLLRKSLKALQRRNHA